MDRNIETSGRIDVTTGRRLSGLASRCILARIAKVSVGGISDLSAEDIARDYIGDTFLP